MAAAFGCQASGPELTRKQADHARRAGVAVLTIDELPDARFDFINTEQVFEHLVDPRETWSGSHVRSPRTVGSRSASRKVVASPPD